MTLDALKHAQRERILFLDQCLTWRGQANRSDLIERFGISTAQAAIDFREYISFTDTPPVYDATQKTYFANISHRPLLTVETGQVINWLASERAKARISIPLPSRKMNHAVIAQLYQALKNQRDVQITYTSMNSGLSDPQWIGPVRFHFDGEAVYLRAWSYKHDSYRDFLPIRIEQPHDLATRPRSSPLPHDEDWNRFVRLWLRPRSDLSDAQAKTVRLEYGFENEPCLAVTTRKALAFYVRRRWRLDDDKARLEVEMQEDLVHP
jgi:hypothetical protein